MSIKVGVIIPDRGDRPEFMKNCERMILNQTIHNDKSVHVEVYQVNYPAKSDKCDITQRYRVGYESEVMKDRDVIFFIENDDWYSPIYMEYMLNEWIKHGKPDLFGHNYTINYNLLLKKYFTMRHVDRASAMNMMIRGGMNFQWPLGHDPYTDQWLWLRNCGIHFKKTFEPNQVICVSMKHGIGKTGGWYHTNELHRYINDDNGFLDLHLDEESRKFYESVHEQLKLAQ